MEFFDWAMLKTMAGAVFAVGLLTQVTKNIPGLNKIPTQVWSYLLAVAVLLVAEFATASITWQSAGLALLNASMVSLAANGGYEAVERLKPGVGATADKPEEE